MSDYFRYGNDPKYLVPYVRKDVDAYSESLKPRKLQEGVQGEISRKTCW